MKARKLKGAQSRLAARIRDWDRLKEGKSDISRKHTNGFKKPGAMKP
jgi:hypothetical protein